MNAPLACIFCGCTDDHACPGGCSWTSVNPAVCSKCTELADRLSGALGRLVRRCLQRDQRVPAALGWVSLRLIAEQARLDWWTRGYLPWEDSTCGGCQLAAMMRGRAPAGSVGATAGCADHEEPTRRGRSKTPSPPAAATSRNRSRPPTRPTPRRKTRVNEKPPKPGA